jgi:hypothetical protein
MAKIHSVQSVGDFTASFTHPLINGGAVTSLTGFKMEGDIVNTAQLMDNSKVIPLLNGDSITITNNNTSGTATFSACKLTGDTTKGDVTAIASALQKIGDNVGGTLRLSFGMNGGTYSMTFVTCTVKTCPPLKVAGTDIPDYAVEFNYADFLPGV